MMGKDSLLLCHAICEDQSQITVNPNVKDEIIKHLEENKGMTLG